jgi:hypothetical protein
MDDLIPIAFPESATATRVVCVVHGEFRSSIRKMPHRHGMTTEMWTGCPTCVLEKHRAKRGHRAPSLELPSRPSYKVTTVDSHGVETVTWPELTEEGYRIPERKGFDA